MKHPDLADMAMKHRPDLADMAHTQTHNAQVTELLDKFIDAQPGPRYEQAKQRMIAFRLHERARQKGEGQ